VPKPFVSVEPTGPSVYRTVDREHPTLIIDEADDLFYRKSDLRAIVNAGWSRGTKIPRQGRWYDPFCPKILGILPKPDLMPLTGGYRKTPVLQIDADIWPVFDRLQCRVLWVEWRFPAP
jgi:hypothetical protein